MLSAGGSDGSADATMRALELGAVEFVRKPSGAISLDLEDVGDELLAALRAAACTNLETLPRSLPPAVALAGGASPSKHEDGVAATKIVCIAASTGGPAALARVIPRLPRFARTAVVIVQHMPAGFTASLASRLHGASRLSVREARHGDPLRAGHAYVAPGGYHLRVSTVHGAAALFLDCGAPEWGVRPAADPLFKSASAVFGASVVGVVLTGMGRDGADGLATVRKGGGQAVVQHRESAVIAGMPDAALRIAGADCIAMLDEIAVAVISAIEVLDRHAAVASPPAVSPPDASARHETTGHAHHDLQSAP
jgi:two-component system chemotaxis response regulator CheB